MGCRQLCWDRNARLLAPKLTSHACALLMMLLIDNVGHHLYLNNEQMRASTLRLILISSTWDCITFHSFNVKVEKKVLKLADLWLVGEMVNRIGIYGSKVAEGLSAFQRRSCCLWHNQWNWAQTAQICVIRKCTLFFSEPEEHTESLYYIPKWNWYLIHFSWIALIQEIYT